MSIRLIGDRKSAYSIAHSLDSHHKLDWTEYPAYVDKERTIAIEGRVMLYATAYIYSKPKSKPVGLSLLDFFNHNTAMPEKAG